MKNRMKQALGRELQGVRVSGELKKRILTEAAVSRMPGRRRRTSVMPLATAAAVVLIIGLAAGVTMLRSEKPDRSAMPLSASATKSAKEVVWVSDSDGLYHWDAACSGMADAHSMTPEQARAEGRKACSECLREGGSEADALVWITNFSNYYHAQHDCSGMTGAVGVLEIEAKTLGRQACAVCFEKDDINAPGVASTPEPSMIAVPLQEDAEGVCTAATLTPTPTQESLATEEPVAWVAATVEPMPTVVPTQNSESVESASVWMTDGGVYYHMDEHCSGMKGAKHCAETEADAAGKKPCPVCMSAGEAEEVVLPTEEPEREEAAASSVAVVMNEECDPSFWIIDRGLYYHSDEHCSGMEGAKAVSRKEAMMSGRQACEICTERTIWVTGGQFWHIAQNCSGMTNAEKVVLQPGETAKQEGCLVCAAGGVPVWTTENGTFYHWEEHCSGMEDALQIMESEALESGKQACPVCMTIENTIDGPTAVWNTEEVSSGVTYDAEEAAVWMTEGGGYYHADEHCSGLEGAHVCSVIEALAADKLPCPKCAEQLGSVWVAENGMYYHLNPDCSDMTEAEEISGRDAVMQGKTLCPNCRGAVVEAAIATSKRHQLEEKHHER